MTAHEQAEHFYKMFRKDRSYLPDWSELTVKQRVTFYKRFLELELAAASFYKEKKYGPVAANINPCSEVVLKKEKRTTRLSQLRIK